MAKQDAITQGFRCHRQQHAVRGLYIAPLADAKGRVAHELIQMLRYVWGRCGRFTFCQPNARPCTGKTFF